MRAGVDEQDRRRVIDEIAALGIRRSGQVHYSHLLGQVGNLFLASPKTDDAGVARGEKVA